MNVQIKVLTDRDVHPRKAHETDACFDVFCDRIDQIAPNKVICYLGFACSPPEGYKAVVVPRSSFSHKGWVLGNHIGTIDSGYSAEWQARYEAIPSSIDVVTDTLLYEEFPYKPGDRIAQFSFEKIIPVEWVLVSNLEKSARAEGSFGSTGK